MRKLDLRFLITQIFIIQMFIFLTSFTTRVLIRFGNSKTEPNRKNRNRKKTNRKPKPKKERKEPKNTKFYCIDKVDSMCYSSTKRTIEEVQTLEYFMLVMSVTFRFWINLLTRFFFALRWAETIKFDNSK